jgi:hypothetical protein
MAYEFNGTNQRLQNLSAVVSSPPLTLACWFNPNNVTASNCLVSITGPGTSNIRFALFASGAIAGDPIRASITSVFASSTSGFVANEWQHACAVFASNSSRTAYLDGGSPGTNTGTQAVTGIDRTNIGCQFISGAGGLNGTSFTNGLIAEVGIWNAALTAAEVASLAKGMTCDKVRPQSLVFYAPLVPDHPRVYA